MKNIRYIPAKTIEHRKLKVALIAGLVLRGQFNWVALKFK